MLQLRFANSDKPPPLCLSLIIKGDPGRPFILSTFLLNCSAAKKPPVVARATCTGLRTEFVIPVGDFGEIGGTADRLATSIAGCSPPSLLSLLLILQWASRDNLGPLGFIYFEHAIGSEVTESQAKPQNTTCTEIFNVSARYFQRFALLKRMMSAI